MPRKRLAQPGANRRYRRYLKQLGNLSENDKALLQQLANIEAEIEGIQNLLADGAPSGPNDIGMKAKDRADLNATQVRLSAEARSLQEALGITRAQRQGEIDNSAALKDYVLASSDFLKDRAIRLTCSTCLENGTKLNLGFVVYHFRGVGPIKIAMLCPNCGAPIVIDDGPLEIQMSKGLVRTKVGEKPRVDEP